jgi:tape measure domain-containing protein
LRDAAKTLLAFGVASGDILPTLRMLGDVASGNEQKLSSLALVFGQVAANARLTGGDVLQFVNATFNPLAAIAKRTGEEIGEVRKRMEQGAVGIDEVRQAFVDATSEGGRFYQSMERQSLTLAGRWSTLSDSAQSVARSVGQVLAPAAGAFVDKATSLIEMLQSLDIETVRNTASMVAFGASFTAALVIIPRIIQAASFLVTALRSVASAQIAVQALSGPKGWAVLIASLGVAAASVYALDAGFSEYAKNLEEAKRQAEQLAESQGGLAESNKEVAKSTTEQLKGEVQAMLVQVEAQQERMRAKAGEIRQEIDNTRSRYEQLRRQLEAGGAGGFTAAVEANTVAGFEAIQRGEATMNVVRAIDKLREQEAADTSRLETRLRALEDALKAGQINVKEVKI